MTISWQLLSQLELAGEEIEDEITTARELLAEEDSEQQLLSLHKDKDSSGVTKRQTDNPKVVYIIQTGYNNKMYNSI